MNESQRGDAEVILSDRVAVRIVKNHILCRHEGHASAIPHDPDLSPHRSHLLPRGCRTSIQWAIASDLIGYKEDLLIFLDKQLNWTAGPDHDVILPQFSLPEKGYPPRHLCGITMTIAASSWPRGCTGIATSQPLPWLIMTMSTPRLVGEYGKRKHGFRSGWC